MTNPQEFSDEKQKLARESNTTFLPSDQTASLESELGDFLGGKKTIIETQLSTIKQDTNEVKKVLPTDCDCGCKKSAQGEPIKAVPAFVIGNLGIVHINPASRLFFMQSLGGQNPDSLENLLPYLREHPQMATKVEWVLIQKDVVRTHVIRPSHHYEEKVYDFLIESLQEQYNGEIDRIAVGGLVLNESIKLVTGDEVISIIPENGCLYSWGTRKLVEDVCGKIPPKNAKTDDQDSYERKKEVLNDFLNRAYYNEAVNYGDNDILIAQNYVLSNVLTVGGIITDVLKKDYWFKGMEVSPSPLSPPEIRLIVVKMIFRNHDPFKPGIEYQFDVAIGKQGGCPVIFGPVRSWRNWQNH